MLGTCGTCPFLFNELPPLCSFPLSRSRGPCITSFLFLSVVPSPRSTSHQHRLPAHFLVPSSFSSSTSTSTPHTLVRQDAGGKLLVLGHAWPPRRRRPFSCDSADSMGLPTATKLLQQPDVPPERRRSRRCSPAPQPRPRHRERPHQSSLRCRCSRYALTDEFPPGILLGHAGVLSLVHRKPAVFERPG